MPAFAGMTVDGASAPGRLALADVFSCAVVNELVDHAAALRSRGPRLRFAAAGKSLNDGAPTTMTMTAGPPPPPAVSANA